MTSVRFPVWGQRREVDTMDRLAAALLATAVFVLAAKALAVAWKRAL